MTVESVLKHAATALLIATLVVQRTTRVLESLDQGDSSRRAAIRALVANDDRLTQE